MDDKKTLGLFRGIVLFVGILFGLLFELHPLLLVLVLVAYWCCVPRLMKNRKKAIQEECRFCDINAYMSQMAQSFIYTQDIIRSLEETAACFSAGPMKQTLLEMLELLEAGKWNIRMAQRDALELMESRYGCEKLRNLHNFFWNAQELGGSCQKEFYLLEGLRISWQEVVESIRIKRIWERNIGTLIYGFFLFICILMLHIMRGSNLDIVKLLPTQLISTALILGLMLFYLFMDSRLGKNLLIQPAVMSEEKANAYFLYLENYNPKKERKNYQALVYLALVLTFLLLLIKPTWITLALGSCLIATASQVHRMVHINAIRFIKKEIEKAFPKWVFDVMLLLQRESVEGALEKSIDTAPPVLKRELFRITEMLRRKPHDPAAYMSFLKEYGNPGINEMMRKLYSLAVGSNRDSEVLDVVIEKNRKRLEKAERDNLLLKDNVKSFTWIPFLCAGFACIGYLVIAIITSINGIIELIK